MIKPRTQRWTDDSINALLKAAGWAEDKAPVTREEFAAWAVLLTLETRLRPSELCAATVGDFDADRGTLRVTPKMSAAARNERIAGRAAAYLRTVTGGRPADAPLLGVDHTTLTRAFRQLRATAGLERTGLHLHDARRTALLS